MEMEIGYVVIKYKVYCEAGRKEGRLNEWMNGWMELNLLGFPELNEYSSNEESG